MTPPRHAVIVGGGIAGIAAALRLAEAGWRPIILESRGKLGGRATSFVDPRSGRTLDNCQHVVMGCCTNLCDFYERLGVLDAIDWHTQTNWARGDGKFDTLSTARFLPAPLHSAIAFARLRMLSWSEKHHIGFAMWSMLRAGCSGRMRWHDRAFEVFLDWTQQSAHARKVFWEPIVVSACNASLAECNAAHAMQVFQEGFLASAWAGAMGVPSVPLRELYDGAQALIARAGGEIRVGESAKAITFDGTRATGVVTDAGFIEAHAVIAAVPPDRLEKLVSSTLRSKDQRLQQLDKFAWSPILGVHLFFPRVVMELSHVVLPGRATQWLFSKPSGATAGGQLVHAVISAADAWMELDEATIVARVLEDVRWALPAARGVEPIEARSVKEKHATFRSTPNVDALRPRASPHAGDLQGGVANLAIAGDWTDTGWPATMEGAVRSGYAAARAITQQGGVVEDLPIALLSRLCGLRRQ